MELRVSSPIDVVTAGDALGLQNDQDNAFQFRRSDPWDQWLRDAHTKLDAPLFGGQTPVDGQSYGFYVGTGDQDNYVKLVLDANGGAGGLRVLAESDGVVTHDQMFSVAVLGANSIDLHLTVSPAFGTVQAAYQVDGAPSRC